MISEEDLVILSAYADGELEGPELTKIRERLLAEPELRRELEAISEADNLLKAFSEQIDSKPVPQELGSLIAGHSLRSAFKLFAVAAAVFVVTVSSVLLIPDTSVDYAVLDELESGQRVAQGDDYIEVIVSFRQLDGKLCRELMTRSTRQVVCRRADTWNLMAESPREEIPADSYQTAGADTQVIDTYIREHISGAVFDRPTEVRAINQKWQDI